MQTRAFRMNLNPGQADEYRKRHDEIWQHSRAARISWTLPMHSKEKSTPPSVKSTITSWIGRS